MIKIQKFQSIIFTETNFEYQDIEYYYINALYFECYFISLPLCLTKSEIPTFMKNSPGISSRVKNRESEFRQPLQNIKSLKNISRIFPKPHSKNITLKKKTLLRTLEKTLLFFHNVETRKLLC